MRTKYIATICRKRGSHFRRWQDLKRYIILHTCRVKKIRPRHWGRGGPIWRDYFVIHISGYIVPSRTGIYTFRTDSDDGSWLLINGRQVVNNGGGHPMRTRTGKVKLYSGRYYKIDIWMYEQGGGAGLRFYWTGPGIRGWQEIPIIQKRDVRKMGAHVRQLKKTILSLRRRINILYGKTSLMKKRNMLLKSRLNISKKSAIKNALIIRNLRKKLNKLSYKLRIITNKYNSILRMIKKCKTSKIERTRNIQKYKDIISALREEILDMRINEVNNFIKELKEFELKIKQFI